MYQRSYTDDFTPSVPKEYDGSISFGECGESRDNKECERCEKKESHGIFQGLQSFLPKGFEIGIEELMLIGAAIILFTSKSRDFECIFILLALIFIK